jgi:hypothetical protein
MYRAGAMSDLLKEMDKYKMDMLSARNYMACERNCDKKELY